MNAELPQDETHQVPNRTSAQPPSAPPPRQRSGGPLPFSRLGNYEIVGRLGSGGMGDVFKGYDAELDRYVAIKVLPPEFARQEGAVNRFRAEAAAAAKVEHPHIVPIYAISCDEGRQFFAMQFVDGPTLSQFLVEQRVVPLETTLRIIEQIVSGLAAAHRFGLVHRDIKPGNILLADGGQRALLADFGLVKSLHQERKVTATGVVVGTMDYISPEQGQGGEVDGRSDLYSVGVLFYQMLAGHLPFAANSPTALIFHHVYSPPPAITAAVPQIPPALAQIVHRLLAKLPEDRYPNCDALLADLHAFRAGHKLPHLSAVQSTQRELPTALLSSPNLQTDRLPLEPLPGNTASVRSGTKAVANSWWRRNWILAVGGAAVAMAVAVAVLAFLRPDFFGNDSGAAKNPPGSLKEKEQAGSPENPVAVVPTPTDLDSALVHHWKFDETSGEISADSRGSNAFLLGHEGKGIPGKVPGKLGNALEFTPPDQLATSETAINLPQLTIAFWLLVREEKGINPRLVHPFIALNYEIGKGIGVLGEVVDPNRPKVLEWQHYAIAIDDERSLVTIYRNGNEVAQGKLFSKHDKGRWVLGHNQDPANPSDSLQGALDDLRVYNRLLTAEEVKSLANLQAQQEPAKQ
ncbi:MAG: protein kinase domain-containing protein [Pirellulaceae bacterium]